MIYTDQSLYLICLESFNFSKKKNLANFLTLLKDLGGKNKGITDYKQKQLNYIIRTFKNLRKKHTN